MNFNKLTKDNFLLFAAKHYDNPCCSSVDDFNNDMKLLTTLKRNFSFVKKHLNNPNTRSKPIKKLVNTIITINNLFGIKGGQRLIFFYLPESFHPMMKSISIFLNINTFDFNETNDNISFDVKFLSILQTEI